MQTGKIIKSNSGFYDVQLKSNEIIQNRARGNFRHQKIKPIVGDWVECDKGYILRIKPRKNEIMRPLIANVDQALIIMAAKQPPFSFNLLDRFLVVLESQSIRPLIYISKMDLLKKEPLIALKKQLYYYLQIGYPVFTSEQINNPLKLKQILAHRETVLAGQTGVGKSTLLNHLIPDLNLATNSISNSLNRGKHTTRLVTLYPYQQGLIADTPGFSSLTLQTITWEKLPQLFPEFNNFSHHCKYRSCIHLNEPDCAVKKAVAAGKILPSRYQNYQQFQVEIVQKRPVYSKNNKRSSLNKC